MNFTLLWLWLGNSLWLFLSLDGLALGSSGKSWEVLFRNWCGLYFIKLISFFQTKNKLCGCFLGASTLTGTVLTVDSNDGNSSSTVFFSVFSVVLLFSSPPQAPIIFFLGGSLALVGEASSFLVSTLRWGFSSTLVVLTGGLEGSSSSFSNLPPFFAFFFLIVIFHSSLINSPRQES